MFSDLGVTVIDTDVIARTVVEPGQPALVEIRKEFGSSVFGEDDSLDRKSMRAIVFADDKKRQMLESILHPLIQKQVTRQAATDQGPYLIVVVPLLVGSPMQSAMQRILVVDCSEKVQMKRLMDRDSESIEQAQRMIDAQASREQRLAIADDVITSNVNVEQTRKQVEALHSRYLDLARADRD